MKYKHLLLNLLICMVTTITGIWIYTQLSPREKQTIISTKDPETTASYARFDKDGHSAIQGTPEDFTTAAEKIFSSLVRITTKINARKTQQRVTDTDQLQQMFEGLFGIDPRIVPEQQATGSGVIISANGYIVTNSHVISARDGITADEITVTMHDNNRYTATLIGKDPASDLAVLKIKAANLIPVMTGNSDELKPGQWVLAAGYPFGLDATVTAGIVSGLHRSIGINLRQSEEPVESFIQTDAVINQGNSGGALITADAMLVGINAAMLSSNGVYNGYGFAIPVNMVKKIAADLIRFGAVQKSSLGVMPSLQKESSGNGVLLAEIIPGGPAAAAGLRSGDLITDINGVVIHSWNALQAQLLSLDPGDKIKLGFRRGEVEKTIDVKLEKSPEVDAVERKKEL